MLNSLDRTYIDVSRTKALPDWLHSGDIASRVDAYGRRIFNVTAAGLMNFQMVKGLKNLDRLTREPAF